MPWHVDDNHPDCSGYAVVKDSDGSVAGCHKTREEANKQMAALYANEPGRAQKAPTDNLVRSLAGPDAVELDGRLLHGKFAVFNRWADIDSVYEGRFREQILPGAFTRSLAEHRSRIKVLYDHGKDPQLGNKPLGRIVDVRADDEAAHYEVELIDTSYNNEFLIPALKAGLLGSSFRFSIPDGGDKWAQGDDGRERSITQADLYEFGPVTFPAYVDATAGVRSATDDFIDSLLHDPLFMAHFIERTNPVVVQHLLESLPATPRDDDEPPTVTVEQREQDDSPTGQPSRPDTSYAARLQMARRIEAERMGVGKELR